MIVFPNCKINLGLRILRKRDDGYHNIETVFYPIALKDVLEIIPAEKDTTISITGTALPGNENDNSCIKAYWLLKKYFPTLPPISIHLHKAIPAGAGLGGGSADGAFALQLINQYFKLGLSENQLLEYALQLGSDSPFFIINKPCIATSRGEELNRLEFHLANYKILIVNPGIHINTAWAFSQIKPSIPEISIEEIITQPIISWKDELINDFEEPVFNYHPEIKTIKEVLYQHGAFYASISGSGSTVYGIFKEETIFSSPFPHHYFVKQI